MKNYLSNAFCYVRDINSFVAGIQSAINQVTAGGVFTGDNLFTYGKCLGFLDDPRFMKAFEAHAKDHGERAVIWRTHTLCWAGQRVLKLDGDFIECGCYKGTSARILCDYLDLAVAGKRMVIYDLFSHSAGMNHHAMPAHGPDLYDAVRARFSAFANVQIVRGEVPASLLGTAPEKIAFLHLDMNNAAAEVGALEMLFERVVAGGSIVLDDYGWQAYRAQKDAEDSFFAARGYSVLELPTGQGLVIK